MAAEASTGSLTTVWGGKKLAWTMRTSAPRTTRKPTW